MEKFRIESDLLGELQVPQEAYYGVQTQRAINNYRISGNRMSNYPDYVVAMAQVKAAAARANEAVGMLSAEKAEAIVKACNEIAGGKWHEHFPTDMVQGGAGTSVNMNANEVIANRALELLGHEKGEYEYCSPNDDVNCAQSTNDAYPTALRLAMIRMNEGLVAALERLSGAFEAKAEEFKEVIKMGRTQLQDAVPMTLGQQFAAYAHTLSEEVKTLNRNADLLHCINMGGTAIGTGINAAPGYAEKCTEELSRISGFEMSLATDLIKATPDTGDYVSYSCGMKRLALKLSEICNDLRLMSSGPRCGLNEINLPAMAPGSSIMPGKVNPVIPEVTNQVCFKVVGNDTTIAIAAEAGQLQLNVMEPIIMQCLVESCTWLKNAIDTLREKCVEGITANEQHCYDMVANSIGIVTALNPYIGYKQSTKLAKEALKTGKSIFEVAMEQGLLDEKKLKEILDPKEMLNAHQLV